MKIRSFLAFDLPPEIKNTVARVSQELRQSPLDARWVKIENIHITIVFMGNIVSDEIPAMGEGAQKLCQSYGPFDVSLKGIGCFPSIRKPRVIWLGLDGDMERMASFRHALQKRLTPFGITEETRAFKPHLTIARFRKPRRINDQEIELLSKYEDLASPLCPLRELILFKSDLKRSGAEYTKLEAWPLSGNK